MATIKAAIKRGLLQYLYDGVQLTTLADDLGIQGMHILTLADALMYFQRFVAQEMQSGKVSTGSSGLGHGVQWEVMAQWRSFDPVELFAAVQEMREVYGDGLITLSAKSINSPTDYQILAVMLADDRLQTITRTQVDYTLIRLPWSRLS